AEESVISSAGSGGDEVAVAILVEGAAGHVESSMRAGAPDRQPVVKVDGSTAEGIAAHTIRSLTHPDFTVRINGAGILYDHDSARVAASVITNVEGITIPSVIQGSVVYGQRGRCVVVIAHRETIADIQDGIGQDQRRIEGVGVIAKSESQ